MDERARRFRGRARAENRGRSGRALRYSEGLHKEAVRYARRRQSQGESVASSARALGVSVENLHRWMKESGESGFRTVTVAPESRESRGSVVLTTPQGFRVEGLSVEELAALIRALLS